MDPKDRRQYPRLEEVFEADVLNTGADPSVSPYEALVPAIALDVSRKGLRLKTVSRFAVGTIFGTIVRHQGGESICLCEVKWRQDEDEKSVYGLFINKWTKLDRTLERRLSEVESLPLALAA